MPEENANTEMMMQIARMAQSQGNSQGDPLNLANSDYPGMSLTTTPFDGTNFIAWSRQVDLALGAKLKTGFIDGKLTRPAENSADLGRSSRADRMVTCWILNSMTKEVSNSFTFTSSARELWKEILERYSQSNAPLVYQIKQELMKTTQGNQSVTTYYSKLKKCWDDLDYLNGVPNCSCGNLAKCTCNVMSRVLELENQDRVMHFLVNLNADFDPVRSQILASDPLPKISKAYNQALQHEKQRQITYNLLDPAAFVANTSEQKKGQTEKKEFRKPRDDSKKCSHCKMTGHTRDGCFEIIGYPDWFRGKRNKIASKMVAQAEVGDQSTPLDDGASSSAGKYGNIDPEFVKAMCQEMMKAFQGKMVMPSANFAGPFE